MLAPLAAMFAGKPPSSSNPTKRLCCRFSPVLESFRRLLLQIGGANIAGRGSRLHARLLRRRSQTIKRVCSLRIHCSLRSLRLAPVSPCLPHSLAFARSLVQDSGAPAWLSTARGAIRCLIAPLGFEALVHSMERRIVGGEGPHWTRRCVFGLEANGYPGEPGAPHPATAILIMLDVDARRPA